MASKGSEHRARLSPEIELHKTSKYERCWHEALHFAQDIAHYTGLKLLILFLLSLCLSIQKVWKTTNFKFSMTSIWSRKVQGYLHNKLLIVKPLVSCTVSKLPLSVTFPSEFIMPVVWDNWCPEVTAPNWSAVGLSIYVNVETLLNTNYLARWALLR